MSREAHLARQRAFYESGTHDHLRARAADPFADHMTGMLAAQIGLRPHHRVLELGAGFGRFTFSLLAHCAAVTAVDLSPRVLEALDRERAARAIAPASCRTLCREVDALDAADVGAPVDAVVGFFLLHHLPDVSLTLRRLAPLLAPGGGLAFVEPNRRNPLYLVQIAACADMHWREEKGLYRHGARDYAAMCAAAGLEDVRATTFGFFPPQVVARSRAAVRLERRLERSRLLRPLLPFILVSGRGPAPRP
jgi:SAM-dependent methyltransferase